MDSANTERHLRQYGWNVRIASLLCRQHGVVTGGYKEGTLDGVGKEVRAKLEASPAPRLGKAEASF